MIKTPKLAQTGYGQGDSRSTYRVNGKDMDVRYLFDQIGQAIEKIPDLLEVERTLLGKIRNNLSPSHPRLTLNQLPVLGLYLERLKEYESNGERVVPTNGSMYNIQLKQLVNALVHKRLVSNTPLTAKDVWKARELSLVDGKIDPEYISRRVAELQASSKLAHLKAKGDYSHPIEVLATFFERISPETHTIDSQRIFVAIRKPKKD